MDSTEGHIDRASLGSMGSSVSMAGRCSRRTEMACVLVACSHSSYPSSERTACLGPACQRRILLPLQPQCYCRLSPGRSDSCLDARGASCCLYRSPRRFVRNQRSHNRNMGRTVSCCSLFQRGCCEGQEALVYSKSMDCRSECKTQDSLSCKKPQGLCMEIYGGTRTDSV